MPVEWMKRQTHPLVLASVGQGHDRESGVAAVVRFSVVY